MKYDIYKSFLNSKKKRFMGGVMAIVTLASIPVLTSCVRKDNFANVSHMSQASLDEEFVNNLTEALNSEDVRITYIEENDCYMIEKDIYMYSYNDINNQELTKKVVRTDRFTISRAIAEKEGYIDLINSKINSKQR